MGIMELVRKLEENKEFAAKYDAFESLDAWLEQAREDGYSVSREELEDLIQRVNSEELPDEEAANAADDKSGIFPTGHRIPNKADDDNPKVFLL